MRPAVHERYDREDIGRMPSDRNFGFVFAGFFLVVSLWPLFRGGNLRTWALVLSIVFLAAALLYPTILHTLNKLWFRFGLLLARVVNPLVTGLLFFIVFTPAGLFGRLLRRDPLNLHFDPAASSYWIERRPPGPPRGTMSNQF